MRAYIGNGLVYYLDFYVEEQNYDNVQKFKGYKDFLDSFTLSYDKTDKSIMDFSNVTDGLRNYTDKNFGMSFKVPADWVIDKSENDYLLFHNPDQTQYLYIHISSLDAGDTLEKWFTRAKDNNLEEVNPSYIETEEPMKTTVAGTEAREWEVYFTKNQKNWSYIHDVYFTKGNYKFYFMIQVDGKEALNLGYLVKTIVPSISVDTEKIKPSMGYIQDTYFYDKSKRVSYKSDNLNYSLSVPAYWGAADSNQEDDLYFEFWGGYFGLSITDESLAEAEKRIDQENVEAVKNNKTFEIEKSKVLIAGAEAIQYRYTIIDRDDVKYDAVEYIIHKDGITYQMYYALLDANRTEKNLEILQKTIESFTFLK
jgi:serine protease Do